MRFSVVTIVAIAGLCATGCDTVSLERFTASGTANHATTSHKSQFGETASSADDAEARRAIEALTGGDLSNALNNEDRRAMYEAQHRALEYNRSGSPVAWDNAASGHSGEVVPGPGYTINKSQCRDYTHKVIVDGPPKVLRGTACRNRDGLWRPIS